MPWWKLTVAYDGTHFAGWQEQEGLRTVQSVMETAWEEITGERRRITASGRTDAGVHAAAQVLGVETSCQLPDYKLLLGLNTKLPGDIAILKVEPAREGFHPVLDAISKLYRYSIHNSHVPPVLERHYVWHLPQQLDVDAMQQAAGHLVGRHDFSSFAVAKSKLPSMVRTVSAIEIRRTPEQSAARIEIDVTGEGFLHNMVRIIVGTLVWVGQGSRPASWVADALTARDRTRAGRTAPAQGLTLMRVDYGEGESG
jgi:tRNA pseudouridine38-40 synthase